MSTVHFTPDQAGFLARFFGPGNLLRWDAFIAATMAESSRDLLTPLIEDFKKDKGPWLLPRVSESAPRSVDWYAMARDARESRALREQLAAFIGPTYTDFTGQHATLSSDDPVECAVAERFGPHVFRLRVLKNDEREEVREQIVLMRSFRDRHPDRTTRLARPVGRLLRDLDMALVVRNEESAWRCFKDLRSRGRLSAHNLAFLRVRILATFERWADILSLPEKNSLVAIRRPARVTHALVQAIYNVCLVEFEQAANVAGCLQRFRELEPALGTLFRSRGDTRDPVVLKAFLVRAVAAQPVRPEAVAAILTEFSTEDGDRSWADALARFGASQAAAAAAAITPPAVADHLSNARFACEAGDYDNAFSLLLECEPTTAVVQQLLACSLEIDSLDAARRSLQFIEQCPSDVRDAALSMRAYRKMWEALAERTAPADPQVLADTIPTGWLPWIQRVNEDGAWPGAGEIARHGAAEWSTDDFRNDQAGVTRFAAMLVSRRPPDGDAVLRNAVPDLLTHFLSQGVPIREFKPIYLNLAFVLAVDDAIGADDLTALLTLAEAVLESAPIASANSGANEFQELLETLEAAWNHVAAPRHVDWALSVLDLLIAFNVRQHALIDHFLHQIVNGFREWSRRIRTDQWDLLEELLDDLGQTGLLTGLRQKDGGLTESVPAHRGDLSGRSLAIYTLTERIGRRAASVIGKRFGGVKVHLIHDKASTDRLEQLARNADIFIVNTWDAKHAATNAIHANRPKDSVTLTPQSKSAGSLVRELYDFLGSTPHGQ